MNFQGRAKPAPNFNDVHQKWQSSFENGKAKTKRQSTKFQTFAITPSKAQFQKPLFKTPALKANKENAHSESNSKVELSSPRKRNTSRFSVTNPEDQKLIDFKIKQRNGTANSPNTLKNMQSPAGKTNRECKISRFSMSNPEDKQLIEFKAKQREEKLFSSTPTRTPATGVNQAYSNCMSTAQPSIQLKDSDVNSFCGSPYQTPLRTRTLELNNEKLYSKLDTPRYSFYQRNNFVMNSLHKSNTVSLADYKNKESSPLLKTKYSECRTKLNLISEEVPTPTKNPILKSFYTPKLTFSSDTKPNFCNNEFTNHMSILTSQYKKVPYKVQNPPTLFDSSPQKKQFPIVAPIPIYPITRKRLNYEMILQTSYTPIEPPIHTPLALRSLTQPQVEPSLTTNVSFLNGPPTPNKTLLLKLSGKKNTEELLLEKELASYSVQSDHCPEVTRNLTNPIAITLTEGNSTHFLPMADDENMFDEQTDLEETAQGNNILY